MSRLGTLEPWWWHNLNGGHKMQDPRLFDIDPRHLSQDERAYVKHLGEHEADELIVRPRDDDPPGVAALLEALAVTEKTAQTYRELIRTLREQAEQNRN